MTGQFIDNLIINAGTPGLVDGDEGYMSLLDCYKLKSIFHNHLTDHFAKLYCRAHTGFDFDEDIYQFTAERNISLSPGYDTALTYWYSTCFSDPMRTLLPFLPEDNAYKYELARLEGESARSVFFSPEKYFNRTVKPKVFDRVFSIIFDEEDFIPKSLPDGVGATEHMMAQNTCINNDSYSGDPDLERYFNALTVDSSKDLVKTYLKKYQSTIYKYFVTINLQPDYYNLKSIIDAISNSIDSEGVYAMDPNGNPVGSTVSSTLAGKFISIGGNDALTDSSSGTGGSGWGWGDAEAWEADVSVFDAASFDLGAND